MSYFKAKMHHIRFPPGGARSAPQLKAPGEGGGREWEGREGRSWRHGFWGGGEISPHGHF